MVRRITILFSLFLSTSVYAQKSLSVQASYSVGILNIIDPYLEYKFYDTDLTQDIFSDLLYYVSDYIQLESGISYGVLNFKYRYDSDFMFGYKDYNANADVYARNNILSFPFGLSFVYPYKKHKFLLGAKVVPTVVFTNLNGYFEASGNKYSRMSQDSTYYVEFLAIDNEIQQLLYPHFNFMYHIGYQYEFNNGMGFSVRFENSLGVLSSVTKFNRYALRFGVIYRIIDYSKRQQGEIK